MTWEDIAEAVVFYMTIPAVLVLFTKGSVAWTLVLKRLTYGLLRQGSRHG